MGTQGKREGAKHIKKIHVYTQTYWYQNKEKVLRCGRHLCDWACGHCWSYLPSASHPMYPWPSAGTLAAVGPKPLFLKSLPLAVLPEFDCGGVPWTWITGFGCAQRHLQYSLCSRRACSLRPPCPSSSPFPLATRISHSSRYPCLLCVLIERHEEPLVVGVANLAPSSVEVFVF